MTGTHPSLSMYVSRCSRCPHRMTWTMISFQTSHMSNMWLTKYRTEKYVASIMSGIPNRHERTYTKLVDRIGVLCTQRVSVEVNADEVESGEERKRDGHENEENQCGGEEKDAWNAECARHGWLSSLLSVVSSLLTATRRSCTLNGGEEGESEALKKD